MADVITRLKLESGEYDSKIKRATQGLLQMEEECRKVGGTLAYLEDEQKQYVQSLGQMDTVSRNVRGKLAELTAAYTELRVQYQRLTDEEKQGDYGKALSSSLEQLKARIGETKSQLNEAGKEIGSSDSLLDKLASKFTINVDAVKLFNAGLQAAKAALGVAQDAFFASESNVDEWGRTVAASQSLYEGFLTAINNGDISGYLSNIDQIVRAARAAYDELDKLGTMKTIQAPRISAQQTENERIRAMIQTGRYIAPQDGRKNAVFNGREMQSGDKLTAGQIRALERHLQNGMNNVVKLVGREVQQTGKAIDAYYNKIAKENGMSLQEFRKGTSSWEEFSKRMEGYEAYRKWNAQAAAAYARQGGRGNVDFDKSNPYAEFRKWGNFRVDKMGKGSYNDLVSLMQQRDQQAAQAYSMQSQAYRTMNRAEGFTVRSIMNGGGGGGKGGHTTADNTPPPEGSIAAQEQLVSELTKKWKEATDQVGRDGYLQHLNDAKKTLDQMQGKAEQVKLPELAEFDKNGPQTSLADKIRAELADAKAAIDEASLHSLMKVSIENGIEGIDFTTLQEKMAEGLDIPDSAWEAFVAEINTKLKELGIEPINIDLKTGEVPSDKPENRGKKKGNPFIETDKDGKETANLSKSITGMADGISRAAGGIEQLGIEIPEGLKSVLGGIQAVTTIIGGIATTVLAIAAITSADAIIPFANGGIVHAAGGYRVPGNSLSGDRVPAMLNSGELVLNRAQQGVLADALTEPSLGGLQLSAVVRGEDIKLALNNNSRRRRRGEYVTSREVR